MTTWLVTGGAGFIGGNFVLDAVGRGIKVVNLDALTYAGNRDAGVAGRRRQPRVRAWRHRRPRAGRAPAGRAPPGCGGELRRRKPVDRSIDGPAAFIQTNVVGTLACWKPCATTGSRSKARRGRRSGFPARVHRRGLRQPRQTGKFTEDTPLRAELAVLGVEGGVGPPGRAFHHTYGLPTLTTNCSNNYGPYQLPGEAHPAGDRQGAGPASRRRSTATAGRCAIMAVRGDHCAAIRTVLAKGRVGETYNVGGNAGCRTSRSCTRSARSLDRRRPHGDGLARASLEVTHVADRRATTAATPSTPASCATNWIGEPPIPSSAASPRPWTGTSRTRTGAARARRRLQARAHWGRGTNPLASGAQASSSPADRVRGCIDHQGDRQAAAAGRHRRWCTTR